MEKYKLSRNPVMRKFFIAILFWAVAIVGYAAEALQSPGGKYNFVFEQKDGRLTYRLDYAAKQVIEEGELGVNIDNHLVESAMGIPVDNSNVWTNGMEVTSVDRRSEDNTWKTVYGEYAQIRDRYNEMTIHLLKGGKHQDGGGTAYDKRQQYLLDIIVRAYDEGVAIRYHFPEATNGLFMHITDDLTSFRFAPGAEAYHYAWAQAHANKVKLLKSEAAWKDEAERPLTLQLANGLYAAIGEAALTDFVRGKLKLKADNELQMAMFDSADIITAYDMPWRFIMVGEKAIDLINNKQMVLNLNAPCKIQDTSWIKPGKAFRVCRLDMKTCMEGVDFCVDRGLQYIELDAGWYGPEMKMSSSALQSLALIPYGRTIFPEVQLLFSLIYIREVIPIQEGDRTVIYHWHCQLMSLGILHSTIEITRGIISRTAEESCERKDGVMLSIWHFLIASDTFLRHEVRIGSAPSRRAILIVDIHHDVMVGTFLNGIVKPSGPFLRTYLHETKLNAADAPLLIEWQ
jgi:hypothetical protein